MQLLFFSQYETTENYHQKQQKLYEGWMQTTQNLIKNQTGIKLFQIAKELLSRSGGTSQVLSLNLSNVFLLLLLKVLIIIAGLLGTGHYGYSGYGYGRYSARRSIENVYDIHENWFTNIEKDLYKGFFIARNFGDYNCLAKAICENPKVAKQYTQASRALLNGIQKFSGENVNSYPEYENLIAFFEKTSKENFTNVECGERFTCII
ncbi:uncharacterized protein LOC129613362 [Condylostylus longicornis]|uniref:uncharacterized protein LOC129613362 n=1 Tax=Condylostylus longicornis TaxID=2530218 RepID=UPI00244DEBDE|nr:uncharacterized protein LOC129613362 [Condylostylus longicornis]